MALSTARVEDIRDVAEELMDAAQELLDLREDEDSDPEDKQNANEELNEKIEALVNFFRRGFDNG
jgi:hypothetical protein